MSERALSAAFGLQGVEGVSLVTGLPVPLTLAGNSFPSKATPTAPSAGWPGLFVIESALVRRCTRDHDYASFAYVL